MHVPPSCQHPRSVNPDNQFPFQNPSAHDETFLFFLGTSLIWRSVAREKPVRQLMRHGCVRPFVLPGNILGGRLCLSFSALSESLRTRVYRNLWQRTLNLICWVFLFFLIRAAVAVKRDQSQNLSPDNQFLARLGHFACNVQEASFRRQISMNYSQPKMSVCRPVASQACKTRKTVGDPIRTFLISPIS